MLASPDLRQFNEAQTLDGITIDQVHIAQQIALVRLHLFVVGEVHRMLRDVYDAGEKVLRRDTSNDAITPALAMQARNALLSSWRDFFNRYTEMMGHALREAASIPFGVLAVYHRDLILPNLDIEEARRRRPGKLLLEQRAADDDVFTQQLEEILVAAQQRVYSDGLRLSGRIWRLEQASRARIDQIVAESLANGWSAWETAQKLEQYLGPNQDCPRWIEARLMGMTKADIAVDNTGLLRGDECDGSGVAYNALRLARNEIQAVHHMATDRLFQRMPWIEKEQINLSPDHAVTDMCDDVVSGGDDGDGVYPKGEISLPLHVHCVTPGQLVETARGGVPIEQVRKDDLVLTHSGAYRPVAKTWSRPFDGTVYEFETEHGHFELTGEHPVLLRQGWVEAQFVEVGDEVLYAPDGAVVDLPAGVAEDAPPSFREPGVASGVPVGMAFMPAGAIGFDGNLDRGEGKINKVSANAIFPLIGNAGFVKRPHHTAFKTGGIGEPLVPERFEHGDQAGVVSTFCPGDLLGNLWALTRAFKSRCIERIGGLLHRLAGHLASRTVSLGPTSRDRLTSRTHWYVVHLQEIAQHAIGNAVKLENLRGFERLFNVNVAQKCLDWPAVFGFKAQAVKLGGGDIVGGKVGWGYAAKMLAANGACDFHDNLLSSSPVSKWGAGSGNPVVDGVANPIQALGNFTTIKAIKTRHYSGPVYNLSVLDDNSYTVNGAVVHNCMCYKTAVLMEADAFVNKLKGWMTGASSWSAMDDYQRMIGGDLDVDLGTTQIGVSLPSWLSEVPVNLSVILWRMIGSA